MLKRLKCRATVIQSCVKFCSPWGSVQDLTLFKAIQFGLWVTSVNGSGSVGVKNGSKLSQKNMAIKCVCVVHGIYTIPCFITGLKSALQWTCILLPFKRIL